jgi:hypothetical protein
MTACERAPHGSDPGIGWGRARKPNVSRRSRRHWSAASLTAVLTLALLPPSAASARTVYVFSPSFSTSFASALAASNNKSLAGGVDVAVDNGSSSSNKGDIYVVDSGSPPHGVIDKFEVTGSGASIAVTFRCELGGSNMQGTAKPCASTGVTKAPEELTELRGDAVGPEGEVFVVDRAHSTVVEFKENGEYEQTLTGPGAALPSNEHFVEPRAVAVNPLTRELFVTDYYGGGVIAAVDEFAWQSGAYKYVGKVELSSEWRPENDGALAADGAGNLYVGDETSRSVIRLKPGTPYVSEGSVGGGVLLGGVGVNPATNELFEGRGGSVGRYGFNAVYSSEPFIESIGEGYLGSTWGVAVASTGNLYIGERIWNATKRVDAFEAVRSAAPSACSLAPAGLQLEGTINPEGTPVTSYQFEYGPTTSYGTNVPQPAGSLPSGTTPEPVSAAVTLLPATTYHCRITASKSAATAHGPDSTFTTAAVKPVVGAGSPPSSIPTFREVVLNGTIDPENLPVRYHVEYGPCETPSTCSTSGYPLSTLALELGASYGAVAVKQELEELQPATTYHYKLIASNEGRVGTGTTEGPEGTFTTAPAPALAVVTGAATGVTQSWATLHGSVAPGGLSGAWRLEAGEDTGASVLWSVVAAGEVGAGLEALAVESVLAGLQAGVTYSYRLVATSAYATVYGAPVTFTTPGFAAAFTQPIAPPLLATPAIAFPKEPAKVTPKKLTRAQQLANALKACAKKPKSKRAACRRAAHKKYGPKPKKKGK